MKIVLLGAPASGKGTLASELSPFLNIPHISTGQMLRDAVRDQTSLGQRIAHAMTTGELISDEIILEVVAERIQKPDCLGGFIFDGFPRTIAQAEALDAIVNIDLVILLEVSYELIVERMAGRRSCPKCGEIYNTAWYESAHCKKCGTPLEERSDQKPEVLKERLKVYETQTAPLISYYEKKGNLMRVESHRSAQKTFLDVKDKMEKL